MSVNFTRSFVDSVRPRPVPERPGQDRTRGNASRHRVQTRTVSGNVPKSKQVFDLSRQNTLNSYVTEDDTLKNRFNIMSEMEDLGYRLRQYRERAGLTQVDVMELSGINQASIVALEKGRGNPTLRTIQRYASAVGFEADLHLHK